ncbi:hypothetical protein D9M71_650920 [compost metagenome]
MFSGVEINSGAHKAIRHRLVARGATHQARDTGGQDFLCLRSSFLDGRGDLSIGFYSLRSQESRTSID